MCFLNFEYTLFVVGINSPPRDYNIYGSKASRIFTTIGAAANLVFAFNTGMLPEIQVGVSSSCFFPFHSAAING